jgi:hypothetical protein
VSKKKRDTTAPKGSKETIRATIWDQPIELTPDQFGRIAATIDFALADDVKEELQAIYGRYKGRRDRLEKADVSTSGVKEAATLQEAIALALAAAKAMPPGRYFPFSRKTDFVDSLAALDLVSQKMRDRVARIVPKTGDKPDYLTESLVDELGAIWRSQGCSFDRSTKRGSFIAFVEVYCSVLELDVPNASINTAVRKLIQK